MRTLPDLLAPDLCLVCVGLNPSLPSVQAQLYFANPRNRFWRALAGAGVEVGDPPYHAAQARLFEAGWLGFTDIVKRPTAGGSELRASDFRAGAPVLLDKLLDAAPDVVWFQGKVTYDAFLRHAPGFTPAWDGWGEQQARIGPSRVMVAPNPSPANAAYSLDELVSAYRAAFAAVEYPFSLSP